MKENRILKTEAARYVKADWDGHDTSGRVPVGDSVLVIVDRADTTAGKLGLIQLVDQKVSDMEFAAQTGTIVACGNGAFEWSADRMRPWTGRKPRSGERIYFRRYAGEYLHGEDDRPYRIMTDKEITAIIEVAS